MADPATMAGVSIGTTILGGIVGAVGAGQSADASRGMWNYKAGIAGLNQEISKQNASWALNSGAIKAANFGLKAGQEIATTKVVQAASGLDVNSGSKEAVRDTAGDVARYDQNTIRADAAHTAYGYEVEAAKFGAEHDIDITAGENATRAGRLGILSSILGAGSSVASRWSQGRTIGIGSRSSSSTLAHEDFEAG